MKLSLPQKALARYLREHRTVSHDEMRWRFRPSTGTGWYGRTPAPMARLIKKGLARAAGNGWEATDKLLASRLPPKGRATALHEAWHFSDPLS